MSEATWDLAAGWDVSPLGRLVDVQSGFACAKTKLVPATEGVAHLRPFNVTTDGAIDLSKVYYIPKDHKDNVEDYALEPGHVLFNNTNSVELVGKTALVRQPMKCAFSNHIYRLALQEKAKSRLEPAWLALACRRLWAMGYFAERCNRWIGQAGFNATKLKEVEIPVPPLPEQRRIVEYLDGVQSQLADVKRLQSHSAAELERLGAAMLVRAFRGEI